MTKLVTRVQCSICILEYVIEFRIQARWALSSGTTLQAVGTSAGIHYFDHYEEYLKLSRPVFAVRKRCVINIISEWDSRIFPNTDSSLVVAKAKSSKDS